MNAETPLLGLSVRRPPTNIQAEQALIGAIMANAKAMDRVEFLAPDHFSDPIHGVIFSTQRRLIAAGGLADAVTLKGSLENSGLLNDVGGTAYLAQLLTAMVGIINAGDYGRAIHEAWKRRTLIDIGETVVNEAFDPLATPAADDVVSRAVAALESAFGDAQDRKAVSLDEAITDALQAADEASRREGPAGLATGFPSIDERLGGLEDGTLNVLAGRPGMGKSALGMQIAVNVARQGIGVLVVSLEMSARELARRIMASMSGVPVSVIKAGKMNTWQAGKLVEAARELKGLPLSIEDGGGLTMAQIDIRVRAAHRRHGVGLVAIDHLHIVKPEEADERNGGTWAIGKISRSLKVLAKRHRIPVLALAQLSRGVEGRDDKRPVLSDLRQAGDIEQDADTVAFVYRAEYYLREPERGGTTQAEAKFEAAVEAYEAAKVNLAGKAELLVEKVRDGNPGSVRLHFDGPTISFSEPRE